MKFKGYIEGYYGRILSWEERKFIVDQLSINNLNTYFYCPKEDPFHRLDWKKPYPKDWLSSFSNFNSYLKDKNINLIFGISPGVDFTNSFEELKNKIQSLVVLGVNNIAILFDDLSTTEDGEKHSEIINECIKMFMGVKFYCVPSEYSSDLCKPNLKESIYMKKLVSTLNPKTTIFWTGDNVISDDFSDNKINYWRECLKHPLIIWDNFYAIDYCMPKIVIDDYYSIKDMSLDALEGILINPTGFIQIDKIILNLFANRVNRNDMPFDEIINNSDLPEDFNSVVDFFRFKAKASGTKEEIQALEKILWNWTGKLKTELYPYLHILVALLKNRSNSKFMFDRFKIEYKE